MNQSSKRPFKTRRKSPVWFVSVAAFLAIFLILQQQQDQKIKPELLDSGTSVSVTSDQNDQNSQRPDTDQQPLSQTDGTQNPHKQAASTTAQSQSTAKQSVRTPASSIRPPPTDSVTTADQQHSELGQLHKTGNQVWESTAGLKYGPGSQEKHRLKHVMRHATDQPRRPGKHGVFAGEGDQAKVLALIDEAYLKALQGGKSVQKKREGQRTVYTVDMKRPVGYVGGQVGNRTGKPPTYKIRLVLEGTSVITAFPM